MERTLRRVLSATSMVVATSLAANAEDEAIRIEHRSAPCFARGGHPRIEARIGPAGEVEQARLLFHASASASWYSVPMLRRGELWTASLPRPAAALERFAYFITAQGPGSRGRLPEVSAFIVDVATSCPGESLPAAERGPRTLSVPAGVPRQPAGFELEGIENFVESVAEADAAPPLVMPPLGLLSYVRLSTVPPPGETVARLREDRRSVTLRDGETGELLTLAKPGRTIEGRLQAVEGGTLVLLVKGGGTQRVRQRDLVELAVRHRGSPAMAVVGGLAGIAGGFLATGLTCITIEDLCHSALPIWIGTAAGAALGASAGGADDWESLPLAHRGPVALTLAPKRTGVALGVRVAF